MAQARGRGQWLMVLDEEHILVIEADTGLWLAACRSFRPIFRCRLAAGMPWMVKQVLTSLHLW
jgi:hypothetical protein